MLLNEVVKESLEKFHHERFVRVITGKKYLKNAREFFLRIYWRILGKIPRKLFVKKSWTSRFGNIGGTA